MLPPEPAPVLILPALILPATVKLPNVPTVVKLEVMIDAFNVVPVKLAALAVIDVLLAAVS